MVRISDNHHKMFEMKSLHRRNESEEIDVFLADKYFSGTNDVYPKRCTAPLELKDRQGSNSRPTGPAGASLDMSSIGMVKENHSKEKKHKHPPGPPTSPGGGGRIAKILNALFNQASLKKGKPKTTSWSSKSVKADEEVSSCKAPTRKPEYFQNTERYTGIGDWRRKRRSSISDFQFHSQPENKSTPSFNSGFRTPPAYSKTPRVSSSFKDFRSYSDHKVISPYTLKTHWSHNPHSSCISKELINGESFNFTKNRFSERPLSPEEDEDQFTKFSEADAGADSDSSSDLFDLPNCDRNIYSNELPVYESTRIQTRIKTTT